MNEVGKGKVDQILRLRKRYWAYWDADTRANAYVPELRLRALDEGG